MDIRSERYEAFSMEGWKGMTQEEFRERLFDVVNESDELVIRDVEASCEDIYVTVEDGSRFLMRCKER